MEEAKDLLKNAAIIQFVSASLAETIKARLQREDMERREKEQEQRMREREKSGVQ
ncbi:MAG: hypothetical protein ABIH23_24780 [bacterium]